MEKHSVLTFTVFAKLLKKTIMRERFLTKSEAEIEIAKIANTAVLHRVEHYECNKVDEINLSPVPTYTVTFQDEEAE